MNSVNRETKLNDTNVCKATKKTLVSGVFAMSTNSLLASQEHLQKLL